MKDLAAFLNDLSARESGGSYTIVNSAGYLGKYQFGELALIDAGYYTKDGTTANDWAGTWTGRDGVTSEEDFLNSPVAQENAIRSYMDAQWSYIQNAELDKYIGTTLADGTVVTESGLLAGAHLKGIGGLSRYIESDGLDDNVDGNGTPISSYMRKFAGYDVSADLDLSPNALSLGWSVGKPDPLPAGLQVVHNDDGSNTYESVASSNSSDGLIKKGDLVNSTFNADGTPSAELISHVDGTVEALTISSDGKSETWTKWDKDGNVSSLLTTDRATGNREGDFVFNGQLYNEDGTLAVPDGGDSEVAVDPTALQNPTVSFPAQSELENELQTDFSGSEVRVEWIRQKRHVAD